MLSSLKEMYIRLIIVYPSEAKTDWSKRKAHLRMNRPNGIGTPKSNLATSSKINTV